MSGRVSEHTRAALCIGLALITTVIVGACDGDQRRATASTDIAAAARGWQLTQALDGLDVSPTNGPLSVSRENPRYFSTSDGSPLLLVGSHTWNNFQDMGFDTPVPSLDYLQYLGFLNERGHNFFRLWTHENTRGHPGVPDDALMIEPLPYRRTGPGNALDGLPKFDLDAFNDAYFERLRARVELAGRHGIYVSIMLFNGWTVASQKAESAYANPWLTHPYNANNNVNGVDGDLDGDQSGEETHELVNADVLAYQERYVRKVIDTVADLDNVLFEISNESHSGSEAWQNHFVRLIKDHQATAPLQHPVGMTVEYPDGRNDELFGSAADWVSPKDDFLQPARAMGQKVWIADTDHICGICGDAMWVWKSFLQGQNPILMDFYSAETAAVMRFPVDAEDARWSDVRRNLGYVRALAERIGLNSAVPRPDLASSGYCLASLTPGREKLVVLSEGGAIDVDLSAIDRSMTVYRIRLDDGAVVPLEPVPGGRVVTLAAAAANEFVLLLE